MIWVEWVEPYVGSDPVYMRVSRETAIKAQKQYASKMGCSYPSDEDALDEFIVVHWAITREEK